jgi:hypothetical protein
VFDYGANRCADEQNSVSGKWAILNRGVYLEVNYNKTSILYEIVKLSDTLMVLTWNGSQGKYTDSYQPTTIAKTQKSGKFVL